MAIKGVRHSSQLRVTPTKVFYEGTDAIAEGQGVCWVRDKVTTKAGQLVDDPNAERDWRVDSPSNSNNRAFAGVAAATYDADALGQAIEIYEPGQVVLALVNADTVIADTYVTCEAGGSDAGIFTRAGFLGRGTLKVLETETVSGNELVLAYLMDGDESGLVEEIQAVTGAAVQSMVGGVTYITAGITIAAESTSALADGLYFGQKKAFECLGTLTTEDYAVTLDTAGQELDGTALLELQFDAAAEVSVLEWYSAKWKLIYTVGTELVVA